MPELFTPEDRAYFFNHSSEIRTYFAAGYNRHNDPNEEDERYLGAMQALRESGMDPHYECNRDLPLPEAVKKLAKTAIDRANLNPLEPVIFSGFSRGGLEALMAAEIFLNTPHADRLVGVLVFSGSPFTGATFVDFKNHLSLYETDYATMDPEKQKSLEGFELPDIGDTPIVWVVGKDEMIFIHQAAGAARQQWRNNSELWVAPDVGHKIEHPAYVDTVREVVPRLFTIPFDVKTLRNTLDQVIAKTTIIPRDQKWHHMKVEDKKGGVEIAKLKGGRLAIRKYSDPDQMLVLPPTFLSCWLNALKSGDFDYTQGE